MKGLERIYYQLDDCRKRLVRLEEMERIPELKAVELMTLILKSRELTNDFIEEGVETDGFESTV